MRVFTTSRYGAARLDRHPRHGFVSLADLGVRTYGGSMSRVIMLVLGAVLALFVLFTFIIPMVLGLLKIALIIGVVALFVFIAVTLVSRSSSSQ
jgi:cobalamin biosynthesis protein CobD/CbiB